MPLLAKWIIIALAIGITGYLLPGVIVQDPFSALIAAMVLSIINLFIRPLIIFFTLPVTILTLGFFVLIINALLIQLTSAIVPGFMVEGFGWALLFSIVLSIVSAFLLSAFKPTKRY